MIRSSIYQFRREKEANLKCHTASQQPIPTGNQVVDKKGITSAVDARRKRSALIGLVLVFIAGLLLFALPAASGNGSQAAAVTTAASTCSSLLVIGARGATETYDSTTAGMGPEAYAAYLQMERRVSAHKLLDYRT